MFIKFNAENFTRKSATALVRKLEDEGIVVETAGMDPIFEGHMYMVCDIDRSNATVIRQKIWDANQGLCVEFYKITEAELENM